MAYMMAAIMVSESWNYPSANQLMGKDVPVCTYGTLTPLQRRREAFYLLVAAKSMELEDIVLVKNMHTDTHMHMCSHTHTSMA